MEKEYKDEQIGDLEGDRGVDPLAYLEELDEEEAAADPAKLTSKEIKPGDEGEDEQEYYDYGELSGSDVMDVSEQKLM